MLCVTSILIRLTVRKSELLSTRLHQLAWNKQFKVNLRQDERANLWLRRTPTMCSSRQLSSFFNKRDAGCRQTVVLLSLAQSKLGR
jgi:hypothetical protein